MVRAGRYVTAAAVAVALIAPAAMILAAQERFQFVVSASDAEGRPVTDIKAEETERPTPSSTSNRSGCR